MKKIWLLTVLTAVSTPTGQLGLCGPWNFGWYGCNILILPHLLKNNAIAAIQITSASVTNITSSGRTIIGGYSETKEDHNEN